MHILGGPHPDVLHQNPEAGPETRVSQAFQGALLRANVEESWPLPRGKAAAVSSWRQEERRGT